MLGFLSHPLFTLPGSVLTVVLAESSGGGTRANIALALGCVTAAGTVYGMVNSERSYRDGRPRRRKRK